MAKNSDLSARQPKPTTPAHGGDRQAAFHGAEAPIDISPKCWRDVLLRVFAKSP
jgi:hypothetical protein